MGASLATYAQTVAPATGRNCRAALGALVLLQVVVFVPTTAYVHWQFAQWSTMYLLSVDELPAPMWTVALGYPVVAVAGFFVAWREAQRARRTGPWIPLAAGAALLALIVVLGRHRLGWLGSAEAFAGRGALTPLARTPLLHLLAAAVPGIAACWAVTLWRLHLLHRAPPTPARQERGEPDREADTSPPRPALDADCAPVSGPAGETHRGRSPAERAATRGQAE